jgi:hypothetical protein
VLHRRETDWKKLVGELHPEASERPSCSRTPRRVTSRGGRVQGEAEPRLRFRPWSRGLFTAGYDWSEALLSGIDAGPVGGLTSACSWRRFSPKERRIVFKRASRSR